MVTIHHTSNKLSLVDYQAITDRLETLNNLYGVGNIVFLNFETGILECKLQYGERQYKFRLDGDTVYFRGHQSNWRKPYRY